MTEYLPPLLRKLKQMGHVVFAGPNDFDLNLIGIRREVSIRSPNSYSDDFVCIWKQGGSFRSMMAAMSTTPGDYYLEHPMRPDKGCAIMAAGQYRGVYKRGMHYSHPGLLQRGGKVKWFRDNDRDLELDLDPDTLTEGYAGLNFHRGGSSDRVSKWSAGCQIVHPVDMDNLLELCRKQEANGPGWDRFSYSLVNEADLG